MWREGSDAFRDLLSLWHIRVVCSCLSPAATRSTTLILHLSHHLHQNQTIWLCQRETGPLHSSTWTSRTHSVTWSCWRLTDDHEGKTQTKASVTEVRTKEPDWPPLSHTHTHRYLISYLGTRCWLWNHSHQCTNTETLLLMSSQSLIRVDSNCLILIWCMFLHHLWGHLLSNQQEPADSDWWEQLGECFTHHQNIRTGHLDKVYTLTLRGRSFRMFWCHQEQPISCKSPVNEVNLRPAGGDNNWMRAVWSPLNVSISSLC